MKRTLLALALIAGCTNQSQQPNATAQNHDAGPAPVVLTPGYGKVHHPVSTNNTEAQQFFDQGFALLFGFNHDEAIRAFQRAAELDPNLAMAHWGIGYAMGPNINLAIDFEKEKAAYAEAQKALQMSTNAPPQERAYIEALVKRYANDPKADLRKNAIDYKNAMGKLSKQYPDDLDAATLYAESAMDLNPWRYWTMDGRPNEGTLEFVATLESVLKRDPNHIGANHYYIHAVEASPNPERALPCAERLKTLAPDSGHLVHMPAHIYIRTGDYEQAADRNAVAAKVDEDYIRRTRVMGIYSMGYYSHNLHFLAVAAAMQGRRDAATETANKLYNHVSPHVDHMPEMLQMMDSMVVVPTWIRARVRAWDEILNTPMPAEKLRFTTSAMHFARGMAYASRGDVANAEKEQAALVGLAKSLPTTTMPPVLNSQFSVIAIAQDVLAAKIAQAKHDLPSAIASLQKALEKENTQNYGEPPDWILPVRESLGGLYLLNNQPADAEATFRAELQKSPRSGRVLFGLRESLKAQNKTYAANLVDRELKAAWQNADIELRIEDL